MASEIKINSIVLDCLVVSQYQIVKSLKGISMETNVFFFYTLLYSKHAMYIAKISFLGIN